MIKKSLVFFTLFAILGSCSRVKVENPSDDFYDGERVVKLKNPVLHEVSGMAASRINPGLFWIHNDSGDEPRIFLVDGDLNIMLTCNLAQATNRDWEDIAIGPGVKDGTNYLYIGDIGDNDGGNRYKYVYVVEEPKYNENQKEITLTEVEKITFELPGEKKDTETLLLDPATKNLYVISKREKPVWLYKVGPATSIGDTLVAEKKFSLPLTQVVGGDISADGQRVLLKNYEHIYYFINEGHSNSLEDLLAQRPFEVPYEMEPQGEAIAWAADFSGFYTLSEKNVGKDTYLYFYKARRQLSRK